MSEPAPLCSILLLLVAGYLIVVVGVGGWLYAHRQRERVPGLESLDDPQVTRAFNWIMAMLPQMRLVRWLIARRAIGAARHGEAVDLGCGSGLLAIELARQSPTLRVTGVDLSDEMLVQAEGYARRARVGDRVSFKKGDTQQIPFPDGSLDLVVSTLSLHHWSNPCAALSEIARVLRPGGHFLVLDMRRDMLVPAWLLLWFATRFLMPSALRRVNEPLASRDAAYTPQEATQLARESQLSDWHVTQGPLWLTIEGRKKDEHRNNAWDEKGTLY